jgi:transcriptional regulator GlxA family with amidase domain
VRALRLEWARERVASGVALAIVASEAGFADQSHFTKAFTRAHGVPPSEYRRRLRASRVPGR